MSHPIRARILLFVNLGIAIALVFTLSVIYWYAWRPLPQTSGTATAPVSQPVSVAYDALGVPHIHAASVQDALFVQGYVTAQDRLFQMDGLRRLAGGNLAEILGPAGVNTDREARALRMRRIAEQAYTTLPEADRAAFAAYTRGVNWYIATHLHKLPLEFTLLAYQPRPWSVVDSILVCLQMFRTLTTTWPEEILKRNMMAHNDAAKVNFLFPVRAGSEVQPGSNAWALAGSHTASGKPLLSNDMHLEYALPDIWYMTQIEAPGLDVSGVALPGTPGIIVGHNQHIAWGITNLQFDVQDIYLEKFDDTTGRYLYHGQTLQARAEHELIRVKGRAPVEMTLWVTRDGPMLFVQGQDRGALRWSAAEPGVFQYPMLDIDRAQDWQQFTAALSRYPGPGANFVYADTGGNIGYHAAGKLPKRRGYVGDLPVDGSSGNYDWDGFIPFDQLPSTYNPPRGIIVSANQNPFPPDYPYPVNGNFGYPGRARQILDLLSAHGGWHASDLLAVQKDVYSGFNRFLASQVVAAYEKRHVPNPGLDDAVNLLRTWKGQMDKDEAAPFLITLIYQHVRNAIVESAAPGQSQAYEFHMAPGVVEKLLRTRPAGWFHDYDSMLLRALADAVEEGKRIEGPEVKHWRYGQYFKIGINNPVVHHVKALGPYFDIPPTPMSGSSTTVKQTTRELAPSMRMDADLSDWDHSLLNVRIGQSGQVLSSHYRDEWEHWYYGQSYPMQFRKVQAKSTLVFHPGR
ncbi:MAG TPA: penicillin acylase family protein [Bryobacteraceae bacterium]|nr:penicillin acylase family protein [Bryobacteraceae bacterium]